jgi:hypothetical protein
MKKILLRPAIALVALSLASLSACSTSTDTQSGSQVDLDAVMTQVDAEIAKFLTDSGTPGVTMAILFPDGKGGVIERTVPQDSATSHKIKRPPRGSLSIRVDYKNNDLGCGVAVSGGRTC